MRHALIALLTMGLLACSGGPAATTADVSPVSPATAGAAVSAAAPPAAPAPKPRVERAPEPESARKRITLTIPDDVACKVTGAVRAPTPLRFTASEAPFGHVRKTDSFAAHVLTGDTARGVAVEAETKDVFVRGFAQAADVTFHPKQIAIFSGLVLPTSTARLHLVRAEKDGVAMRLDLPSAIRVGNRKSLEEKLECGGISLEVERFDPHRAYLPPKNGGGHLRGSQIPIATSASSAPVATLVLGSDTWRTVSIHGREGRRVLIVWELDDLIVFGWIDARSVEELPEGGGGRGEGIGLDGIGTMGGCCAHIFVCDHEVPIRATLGEKSEIVGVSRRGVKLKTNRAMDGRHELHPSTFDGFDAASGAKLSIDADRVVGCADLEKKPP